MLTRTKVGVLRGGPSSEYEVSLSTGENVLRNLDTDRYAPVDILLTKNGEWLMNGVPTTPAEAAESVDVVWNALHGSFGEDGQVQRIFERFGVPYTGSGVIASAVGMQKPLAKERFSASGLRVARGELLERTFDPEQVIEEFFPRWKFPFIVKPASGGSSVATSVVRSYDEAIRALLSAVIHGDVLVEELIEGKEATCCVIDAAEEGEHFALFPIEIVPPKTKDFFDYDAKYSGASAEICPGRFPLSTHAALRDAAVSAHRAVGARHYSRSDFIITPEGEIYILEINTLPGLTKESLLPKALKAGGVEFPDFLDHVIGLALSR